MLLSEAWTLYDMDKRLMNYSRHTLKAYKLQVRLLSKGLNGPDIKDITYEQLKFYLAAQSATLSRPALDTGSGLFSPFSGGLLTKGM